MSSAIGPSVMFTFIQMGVSSGRLLSSILYPGRFSTDIVCGRSKDMNYVTPECCMLMSKNRYGSHGPRSAFRVLHGTMKVNGDNDPCTGMYRIGARDIE